MIRGSKIDTILTWLFMVLAVAAVVCYFAFPENRLPFLYCGLFPLGSISDEIYKLIMWQCANQTMCQSILLLTHSLTGTLANYHIINISTLKNYS